jgi:hypothetical protein
MNQGVGGSGCGQFKVIAAICLETKSRLQIPSKSPGPGVLYITNWLTDWSLSWARCITISMHCITFRNKVDFCGGELLALRPARKVDVSYCIFLP